MSKINITLILHGYEIIAPWLVGKVVERCEKQGLNPTDVYRWIELKGTGYDNHGYSMKECAPYYTQTGDRGKREIKFAFEDNIDLSIIDAKIDEICNPLPRGIATLVELTDGKQTIKLATRFKKHRFIKKTDIIERAQKEREKELAEQAWWNSIDGFYRR